MHNVYNATVSLYKKDDASGKDFFLTLQNGQPDYPHNPLETSDYNKNIIAGTVVVLTPRLLWMGPK